MADVSDADKSGGFLLVEGPADRALDGRGFSGGVPTPWSRTRAKRRSSMAGFFAGARKYPVCVLSFI